jgi:hypothetical protein
MAALSPAESLFLLKPNRTPARETVKVTLLSLLAQGIVRLEEQVTKRFIGTRKTVYVRLTQRPQCLARAGHRQCFGRRHACRGSARRRARGRQQRCAPARHRQCSARRQQRRARPRAAGNSSAGSTPPAASATGNQVTRVG